MPIFHASTLVFVSLFAPKGSSGVNMRFCPKRSIRLGGCYLALRMSNVCFNGGKLQKDQPTQMWTHFLPGSNSAMYYFERGLGLTLALTHQLCSFLTAQVSPRLLSYHAVYLIVNCRRSKLPSHHKHYLMQRGSLIFNFGPSCKQLQASWSVPSRIQSHLTFLRDRIGCRGRSCLWVFGGIYCQQGSGF